MRCSWRASGWRQARWRRWAPRSGGHPSHLAQSFAQRVVAPTPTALWLSLEAVFAAVISVALGRERLTPVEWAGGGLMVLAAVLAQWAHAKKVE